VELVGKKWKEKMNTCSTLRKNIKEYLNKCKVMLKDEDIPKKIRA
jgi:glycyl-tRNA synthetase beta subunit